MKITIVTISFNQEKYLEQAIKSVIEQDYENIEYIIVDAGSTDGSKKLIDKYRSKIDKVIIEPDRGPADGLNKGFNYATGDLYGYLNADDAYVSGTFKKVVKYFKNYPLVDVIYGGSLVIDQYNKIIYKLYSDIFNIRRFIYLGVNIAQPSTFFRRNAFKKVGGFNIENKVNWDAELILDMALQGVKFKKINEFWSYFRLYDLSITGSMKHEAQYLIEYNRLFKKIYNRNLLTYDIIYKVLVKCEKGLLNPLSLFYRMMNGSFYKLRCKSLKDSIPKNQ